MNQIEINTINSFKMAKSDIIELQNRVIELSEYQKTLLEKIDSINNYQTQLYNKVKNIKKPVLKKVVSAAKRVKKIYVASKSGKKFHLSNCPFAHNIKPKTKVTFKTKDKALNVGYKPCECI